MSIKKLLILSAASLTLSGTFALAGGPDNMPQVEPFHANVYVDLQGGYAFQNWNKVISNMTTIWANPAGMKENEQGGFVGGMDAGFHFIKNFAIELGGFYMPKVEGNVNGSGTFAGTGCQNNGVTCTVGHQWNWIAYAAGKFIVDLPYLNGFDMYAKLGGSWRAMANRKQFSAEYSGRFQNWEVMFGGGLEYIMDNLKFGAQWLYLPAVGGVYELDAINLSQNPEAAKKTARTQPAANILTANIGYQFAI